ncbi:MarR family winged helix-turn-helix transcriptional regulator [Pediococcus argentinicus]|uniref:HTH marR-type domain-containing protein n=1 Tax=Pediococcus argentinicus TaxID=480391 RepID=A0A0R2NLG8_9LACO|nr:MarR family transcriptional regulator [Pediococcus argentinicus]KRO24877.1 hypothetical protein IV88_GL000540 [Pediococcus argentinicus]NKZ22573.1 MarR family transcriptional regulator [Pediococcus argentinicus]GEP19766.1 hypothetical protein LSA03_11500 [Pediococcus argentinicus]
MNEGKLEQKSAHKLYVKGFKYIDITLKNAFRKYYISYEQYIILNLIDTEHLNTTDISERLFETKSAVSRQLTSLSRSGLIEFEDVPGDRRFTDIKVTEQGYDALKKARKKEIAMHKYMKKTVGVDNLQQYFEETMLIAQKLADFNDEYKKKERESHS